MAVEQRILKIARQKRNKHGGNQQSVWCSPASVITVCPSFYPVVLGQMNGISFCCHCDNIFLHALLSNLQDSPHLHSSQSTRFLRFSFSPGGDVSEKVWGGEGRHLEVGLITPSQAGTCLTLLNQWL